MSIRRRMAEKLSLPATKLKNLPASRIPLTRDRQGLTIGLYVPILGVFPTNRFVLITVLGLIFPKGNRRERQITFLNSDADRWGFVADRGGLFLC